MSVIRSWHCLNPRCNHCFEAWEPNPICPHCGNVRVQWIPGGGHVAGTAKALDAELRNLADCFKMDDINSARRDERAKPKMAPQPVAERGAPSMQFAPGFTAPLVRDSRGSPVATCLPSTTAVNFKAKVGTGVALGPGKLGMPAIGSGTAIEASHRPAKAG